MQVPAISNVQSNKQIFQGSINIINDLSYNPCRYVRKAYDSISKELGDKPFDLFIKQDYKTNSLLFIAQKMQHAGRKNKPFVKNVIANAQELDQGEYTTDLYAAVARETINSYNDKFASKTVNVKEFFKNVSNKFLKSLQDADEI